MDEKNTPEFSPKTEEIYQKETENSIKIPEGFKEKIMEKVTNEKTKKQGIIKWAAIAACIVIVVGVIIVVPGLINPKTAENDTALNGTDTAEAAPSENASDELSATADSADTEAVDHHASEKCDPIIPNAEKLPTDLDSADFENIGLRAYAILSKHLFVLHEGHELNWYEFYNGCIEGTVGQDSAAIRAYAEDSLEIFTQYRMTEQAAQAQTILDALGGEN